MLLSWTFNFWFARIFFVFIVCLFCFFSGDVISWVLLGTYFDIPKVFVRKEGLIYALLYYAFNKLWTLSNSFSPSAASQGIFFTKGQTLFPLLGIWVELGAQVQFYSTLLKP